MPLKDPRSSIQIKRSDVEEAQGLHTILQAIYNEAAEAMSGLMDTRNMYIALYDEDTGIIEFPLAYQAGRRIPGKEKVKGEMWAPRHFGARKGLTEWIILHKASLLIEKDFDMWVEDQEDVEAFKINTKCWLGAPMLLGGQLIGVIGLQNFEQEGIFDRNHRDILEIIAGQAAIAIQNARLFDERRIAAERKRRLALLQQISQKMAEAGLDSEGVLGLVAQAANDVSGSDLTAIYLYDQESSSFTSGVSVLQGGKVEQLAPDDLPGPRGLPGSEGLPAHIAGSQKAVFVDDAEKRPETTDFARSRQLRAFAGLPLTIADRQEMRATVGVLFVNFEQPHDFSADEQEILRHLANQATVAIAYASAQASAQAREQLAALGTAAATLQHRLGNTINIILPAVMRLRQRGGDDPTHHEILDTIERNVSFATEVIRRMQEPLRPQPFVRTDINSLLREAIQKCIQDNDSFSNIQLTTNLPNLAGNGFSPSTVSQQIKVIASLDEQLPETYASSGQLTEVFRVLVENGIKAIYPQAGSVMIKSKLESDRLRQFVKITVSDTGKGIDEKTRSRLFKQPVPRKEFGKGAGLGLWLSNIIMRSHQGSIRLEATELNKGSTFLVRLPILNQVPPSHITAQRGGV